MVVNLLFNISKTIFKLVIVIIFFSFSTVIYPTEPRQFHKKERGLIESIRVAEPVNINTADELTLSQLPGIGNKKAKQILSYRRANGPFKKIAEIKQIKGVNKSVYTKIKPLITV